MTREEAIKIIESNCSCSGGKLQEACAMFIPELRESEDEKIIKSIIRILQVGGYMPDEEKKKALAWLERLRYKEKYDRMAPIYEDKESFESALGKAWKFYNESASATVDGLEDNTRELTFAKGFREGFLYKERQKKQKLSTPEDIAAAYQMGLAEGRKEQQPKMIQWTGKNLKEVIDFTGKSQRFDEWFKSWEGFENYVHTHNDILKLFCEDGSYYEVPVGAWIVKTPDGYNIPSSFRFIQKPTEWSERDEEMIARICSNLEYLIKEAGCDSKLKEKLEERIKWMQRLKSLRPSWKPSEEQMECLQVAASQYRDSEVADTLWALVDDLKKSYSL